MFTVNFSEVKVKVQGQNCHTENLQIVIARPQFKTLSPNLAKPDRDIGINFGMKYDFAKKSRWLPGRNLHFLSAF